MTAVAEQTAVRVALQGACEATSCATFASDVFRQLSGGGYGHRASGLVLGDHAEYLTTHRTARKRAQHARNLGYQFAHIDREDYEQDVYAINTSTPERQGRRMSEGYWEHPSFSANPLTCFWHHVYTYGVMAPSGAECNTGTSTEPSGSRALLDQTPVQAGVGRSTLVAYLWLYRVGELAMVSSILGHADHLRDDVMWLLATETIREQAEFGGVAFYNRHDSGTDGLRYFKERLGFRPTEIQWAL